MARGLLIVDIQRDYFPSGAHPLVEPEAAAAAAQRVLEAFRSDGEPVIEKAALSDGYATVVSAKELLSA